MPTKWWRRLLAFSRWMGLEHYIRRDACAGFRRGIVMAPSLAKHATDSQARETAILKERRTAREDNANAGHPGGAGGVTFQQEMSTDIIRRALSLFQLGAVQIEAPSAVMNARHLSRGTLQIIPEMLPSRPAPQRPCVR